MCTASLSYAPRLPLKRRAVDLLGADRRRRIAGRGGLAGYARARQRHHRLCVLGPGRRGWANASAYCAAKLGLTGFTRVLAAEGKPRRIGACVLYPGTMVTSWGVWSPGNRGGPAQPTVPPDALPPEQVAQLITWIAAPLQRVVLNEVTVTPLLEQSWP